MKEYMIELEIFEGKAGELHTDGTYPDFAKEGDLRLDVRPVESGAEIPLPR